MRKILLYLLVAMMVATTTHAATAYRYHDSVTTVRGDAVGGASVTVYVANTTTKASLYLYPSTAGTAKSNPTYTDGYGRFSFYVAPGLYDLTISGANVTTYTVEDVRVFSDTGYVYNVQDYGAVPSDAANDTTGIKAAIDAAEASDFGGTVYFPPGVYIASDIKVRGNDICLELDKGAMIVSASTSKPAIKVDASDRFSIVGRGRIVGPGKSSALSGCYGVSLDSLSGALIKDVEIYGFYHGVRAWETVKSSHYENLFIHDIKHTGLWPHSGDHVIGCRFYNIGTLSVHHGVYIDDGVDGAVLVGNTYRLISGAAVHIYDSSAAFLGISCTGERSVACGYGYLIDSTNAKNISIVGAVIDSCLHVATHDTTGFGIKINNTARNLHVQAVISYTDSTAVDLNATAISDSEFDIVATAPHYRGVNVTADDCSGRFVINDAGATSFYMNDADRNNFVVMARGGAAEGLYVNGSSTHNVLDVYLSNNGTQGAVFVAGGDSNVIRGVSKANVAVELNNMAAGTDTTGLKKW